MKKKSADFKRSTNTRGFGSFSIETGGYVLEVTRTGTVYWDSGKGKRKLESLFFKKTSLLSVSLPDWKEIQLYNTPEGLKVK